MDKNRQLELYRKRNIDLNKKLDALKSQMKADRQSSLKDKEQAESLIADLEKIKEEWTATLDDLHARQEEYRSFIHDLQDIRRAAAGGFRETWRRKWLKKRGKD